MRILILTGRHLPTIGGTQAHVKNLSNELRRFGNDVSIIAEKNPWSLRWREIINGVIVYRAPIRASKFILLPIFFFLSIFGCKKSNPDIVHAHFALPSGLVALVLSKIFGKPFIITVHGADILRDSEAKYGLRLNPILDIMTKFVLRRAPYVIACSEFVKREVERCGVRKDKIKVITNGVDEIDRKLLLAKTKHRKFRKELGLPESYKVLFTARRLIPKNGVHYLLRAMKKIAEQRSDVLLIVAGDGPQFKELVEMAKIMKLSKVQFLGEVDSLLLEKLYVASDIVVIPSLIEAAGIIALESMAYMKPLVAFDSGGLTEIISENKVGVVVRNRDIDELSRTILEVVDSPSLLEDFSNNCQKNIKKYSWDKITKEVNDLYHSLL